MSCIWVTSVQIIISFRLISVKLEELGFPVLHNHPLTQLNMPVASSRQRRTDRRLRGRRGARQMAANTNHTPPRKMKLPSPLNVFDSKRGKEKRCRFQSEFPREIVSTQFASCDAPRRGYHHQRGRRSGEERRGEGVNRLWRSASCWNDRARGSPGAFHFVRD